MKQTIKKYLLLLVSPLLMVGCRSAWSQGESRLINEAAYSRMRVTTIACEADSLLLRTVCSPLTRKHIEAPEFGRLVASMIETVMDPENEGVGIAAPQVGILKRVVLVDTGDEILELINPELIETSGEQTGLEGCLSVPGKYGIVTRPMIAKVRAQDREGNWYEAEGEELTARCFCHELDHLDGIVYTEKMERFLTEEELEEL